MIERLVSDVRPRFRHCRTRAATKPRRATWAAITVSTAGPVGRTANAATIKAARPHTAIRTSRSRPEIVGGRVDGAGSCRLERVSEQRRQILRGKVPDEIAPSPIHGDACLLARRREPAVPGDDGDDPRPLGPEAALAHHDETGRLDHTEHPGAEHAGVGGVVPPVDAAAAPRRRSRMFAEDGHRSVARVRHDLRRAGRGQRRAPDDATGDRRQRQRVAALGRPAALQAPCPVAAERTRHEGAPVVATAHAGDLAHGRVGTGSPGGASGAAGGGSTGTGRGRAGSSTGSKMISRRTGPISPARAGPWRSRDVENSRGCTVVGVDRARSTRDSAIASLQDGVTTSVHLTPSTGKGFR